VAEKKQRQITRTTASVSPADRAQLLGHKAAVLWLTGLSGSGKSTVAHAVEKALVAGGRLAYVLDGDNVRHGLNSDLGFSAEERKENIRRISEVAALFADAGLIVLVSFISPYRKGREVARKTIGAERFLEIHLDVPLEVCEARDPKGLYAKARAGEIADFTGVSAPFEAPENPDLKLQTGAQSLDESVRAVLDLLQERGVIGGDGSRTPEGEEKP